MVFKEALEYSNVLKNMYNEIDIRLLGGRSMYKSVEVHRKSLVDPTLEDEIVDKTADAYNPDKVIDMFEFVNDEMEQLKMAISEAKRGYAGDIDMEISANKVRRSKIEHYKRLLSIEDSKMEFNGVGYRFNADGNQVSYAYKIETNNTVNFDRNRVRELMKKTIEEADEASIRVDKMMIDIIVDFEPRINLKGLTFKDLYEMI